MYLSTQYWDIVYCVSQYTVNPTKWGKSQNKELPLYDECIKHCNVKKKKKKCMNNNITRSTNRKNELNFETQDDWFWKWKKWSCWHTNIWSDKFIVVLKPLMVYTGWNHQVCHLFFQIIMRRNCCVETVDTRMVNF